MDDTGEYLYLKNLQGDIVGVVDEAGNVITEYQYGSFGKTTINIAEGTDEYTTNIIKMLPLAYRGCYYESTAKLYFTEKRFYNPEWGRFLNTPEGETTDLPSATDYDLYTYWENHPFWYTEGDERKAYEANSEVNEIHNKKFTDEMFSEYDGELGFIHDQTEYKKADENWYPIEYRYGVNVKNDASCGWVATYNALMLLGNPTRPEEIIREYEEEGIFLYGIFGTHPLAIAHFFTEKGYEVNIYFDDFDKNAVKDGANIIFIDRGNLDHYIAIGAKESNFYGYNVYDRNDDKVSLEIDEKSITYTKENEIKTENGKMLITISLSENN